MNELKELNIKLEKLKEKFNETFCEIERYDAEIKQKKIELLSLALEALEIAEKIDELIKRN